MRRILAVWPATMRSELSQNVCPSHNSIVSPHVLQVCWNLPVAKKLSTASLQSGQVMARRVR
jgi:hypothetical protein